MKSKRNRKKQQSTLLYVILSAAMLLVLCFVAYAPATTVTQVHMTKELSSAYLTNEVNQIIAKTMDVEVARMLPYDFSSPQNPPDKSNYYTDGNKTCYKDSTIEVICWKERNKSNTAEISFADVTIKHPSQFRRQWANGDYNSKRNQYPTTIFAGSNGVVGMSSDFYKFRKFGIAIQYGTIICDKRSTDSRQKYLDVLVIDYSGDFHIWKDKELSAYIAKNGADDIMLSFTFGPALVQNGKAYDPSIEEFYVLGEPDMHSGRAAIGQLGPLHYLLCTTTAMKRPEMADIMLEKNCITAYNLDGGQTGTMVMNGKVYNKIAYRGTQRDMSDIIYFCSAE